ncbi:CotH kinase family protein [Neolewinella agarilytica]|uniref:CotH kinase family protein n=1 Tax=Neolewinella agarilytica TaxID=478744 RepID=UPI002355062C|nr:CotH kinase family protein [Neolewinella agarilytica]
MSLRYHFSKYLFCFLLLVFPGAGAGAMEGMQEQCRPTAGFYASPIDVSLPVGVRYTLNGSTPTAASPIADGAFRLTQTTVVRYAAFTPAGKVDGFIHGATYFIAEPDTRLMTLSIAIDDWRLFNGTNGWFRAGPGADPGHWKQPGANWWTKREHPAHFDLFEADGALVHSSTVGFRMFGGMSRLHPQKSFSLSARKKYGQKRIKHDIFDGASGKSFQFLVARNGGSDWGRSYVRDALLTGLLKDESWDLDHQAGRPVQVYLNGKYWGIYHLREKINPQFIADRHEIADKDKIDLLEHQETVKHGQLGNYRKLVRFIENNDLSKPANYRRIQEWMDVDNYQRLQIAQTYFDNRDAGGNIRFWRDRSDPESRWRWILYDVDQGFGLHDPTAYENNSLAFYTEANGPSWPNPPWSTLLQRRLLANPGYRRGFVNRSLDYLATDFRAEVVLAAIERRHAGLAYDMPRQLQRWKGKSKNWDIHFERLRTFARERPAHLREQLRTFFGGGADREVSIIATAGGYVTLNHNITVDEESFRGRYFENFPLHLRAVAHPGFRFVEWEGLSAKTPSSELSLGNDREVKAIFEPFTHPLADVVIINEIRPRGKAGGDWLELYNRSTESVELLGWQISDGHHTTRLPNVTIGPNDYLVICEKEADFRRAYPAAHMVVGGLGFGLDKDGETLGLYGPLGGYVNQVTYTIADPDTSFVHALVLPGLDNTDIRHWATQSGSGTPCTANPDYLQTAVVTQQDYWLRIGIGVGVLLLIVVVRSRVG